MGSVLSPVEYEVEKPTMMPTIAPPRPKTKPGVRRKVAPAVPKREIEIPFPMPWEDEQPATEPQQPKIDPNGPPKKPPTGPPKRTRTAVLEPYAGLQFKAPVAPP